LFSLNFFPEPTGTGKYSGELAEWLVAKGHDVDVIAGLPHYPKWEIEPGYRSICYRREIYNGVNILRAWHYVPPSDRLSTKTRILLESTFSISSSRYWLPRWFFNKKYDVVVAVSPPMQLGIFPLVYRWLRRVPWVLHIQDLQVDAAIRLGMLRGRFSRSLYGIEYFLLNKATRVSTITEAMRRRIIEKGIPEKRTWLLPNWSDISFVRPLPHDNNFRRDVGIKDDQVLVMYAGNMGEKQGLELVIQAADSLRGNQRVEFFLVGSGAARTRLEQLASDLNLPNLQFLPVQPIERLPEMLAAADIHLVVQRREAADLVMPSKLTNILAAGRPSIATADEGTALHQVLTEHKAGIVTPPGNVSSLTDAIARMSIDPELRSELGRNARSYAERYLDKERILLEFEQRLLQLVKEDG